MKAQKLLKITIMANLVVGEADLGNEDDVNSLDKRRLSETISCAGMSNSSKKNDRQLRLLGYSSYFTFKTLEIMSTYAI